MICLFLLGQSTARSEFVLFESGQVRPLALSPDGAQLFAVNTPDNHLEVFRVDSGTLIHSVSVPVGLEPVAVAARTNHEVWVVNHLSDSVCVIDLSSVPPRVVRTILVGDEPRDIVFAGTGGNRAFITTAHRGQNSPYNDPANPGELTTSGIGRADVWVFDADDLGSSLGGDPITIVTHFADTPRALAVTPDGSRVYAAAFKSGNRTATIAESAVCDGGDTAAPCRPQEFELLAPGGLPAPNQNIEGVPGPETGLIVKFNGGAWIDELGRNWRNMVRFDLPDQDVFAIDANANPPVEVDSFEGVGTVLFNMAVNPVNGKVYVTNTQANNFTRFEGTRPAISPVSSVVGHLHRARITVIDPSNGEVATRGLNKLIDYSINPAPAIVKAHTLATPMGMAVSSDGQTLYVAAAGSNKVGIYDTQQLEQDSFVPALENQIVVPGGGPTGLVLDEVSQRLYVLTRFTNSIAVIDTEARRQVASHPLHSPEPVFVRKGRRFLYDATLTSSNGEASCAACHVEGDKDELAWDLGNPLGVVEANPNPFIDTGGGESSEFHPMKGPMTTQTFRGMATHGPMHWRGDRTGGSDPEGDPLDEVAAFKRFNVAFEGLLGRTGPLSNQEIQLFTDFALRITPPPNPIRNLDDSLTPKQAAGRTFFFSEPMTLGGKTCNSCHLLDPINRMFGTSGRSVFRDGQAMKVPQLRNMYDKVGKFGQPATRTFIPGGNRYMGPQIRGFGYNHDGSTDTLERAISPLAFFFPRPEDRKNVVQFLFAIDSNLKPIVGQQITLTASNATTVDSRADLLVERCLLGDCDLIVKGTVEGRARGAVLFPDGQFAWDDTADGTVAYGVLRALAQVPGQELTFTAVPLGSGFRIGIDRDRDLVLDGQDNCPGHWNHFQGDTDGDGVGDPCDLTPAG